MKTILIVAAILLFGAPALQAQDSIALARDLYTAANYDDALLLLGRLDSPGSQPAERLAINQYRAFCLLALGRTAEAERAIEAVVSAEPGYHPASADASPRLRSAFASVRQRVLPAIVQQQYLHAKAAFDRQDFSVAAAEFDQVLQALVDPDLGDAAGRPPLADLRTLATGFRDLSAKALVPVVVQMAPPAVLAAPAPVPPPAVPVASRIYGGADASVLAPVTVRQDVPSFPRQVVVPGGQGVLEVIINEAGGVESVAMRSPINPRYDALVITAARGWRYQPATLNGTPVRYRKYINITLKPGS